MILERLDYMNTFSVPNKTNKNKKLIKIEQYKGNTFGTILRAFYFQQ